MSETSYINCECKFDENIWEVQLSGTPTELGFITTAVTNAVRGEFIAAGYTDEQAKRLIIGGIQRFWGMPEFIERIDENEDLSK